jgi:L-asparaginase
METYEVGKKLKDEFSILEAKDMTLEALLTKLMWIMAHENQSWDDIVDKFYTPVAFDTLY